jgi:pimeloyl-ACP methyl ester carboxylesterase
MNFIEKEAYIPYGDGSLYCLLCLTEGMQEKYPCFVLSHGIYSSYQMTAPSARELAQLGYACICFDFKGCSYSNKSGGDLLSCSVQTEADELCAVIEWMRSQDFADISRIYLLGQSLGGVVSVLAGARIQSDVVGMLLMYPALSIMDIIPAMFPEAEKIPEVVENYLGVPGLNLGRKFFAESLSAPVSESVKAFKKPVWIIHGTEDKLVPISYGEKAAQDFISAKLVVVPGAEHGFNLTEVQAKEALNYFRGGPL